MVLNQRAPVSREDLRSMAERIDANPRALAAYDADISDFLHAHKCNGNCDPGAKHRANKDGTKKDPTKK